jgi:hypothetical protein
MGSLSKLQRTGVLIRLRNNRQCTVDVLCAAGHTKELANAQDFASVLREAGWTVSGPEPSEYVGAVGAEIGIQDLSAHGVGAHLLLDTLTAVGISARLRPAKDLFPDARSTSYCLPVGTEE